MRFLVERLTYDQLFRYSEPKRVKRSATVRGPPLEIDANSDAVYHSFNFKSFPSTTGLRHHGYIKFVKPKGKANGVPLQHIPCVVDCTCPDMRYRWAWVLKQHQSGAVGDKSLNKALNLAPKKTNPAKIPGLCKHILAARNYIYGLMSHFPDGEPDTAEKLDKLVKYADKRWSNFDQDVQAAKQRDAWYTQAKQALRQGKPLPPNPPPNVVPPYRPTALTPAGVPELPEEPQTLVKHRGPVLPKAGTPKAVPQSYAARITPPSQRGRTMPSGATETDLDDSLIYFSDLVCREKTANTMSTIAKAKQIVEELEDSPIPEIPEIPEVGAVDAPLPSEPPISDQAVDADTAGNVVISLLTDIRNSLQVLAGDPGEMPPPDEEDPADQGDGVPVGDSPDAVDAIPEAPDEDEDEERPAGKRPSPTA